MVAAHMVALPSCFLLPPSVWARHRPSQADSDCMRTPSCCFLEVPPPPRHSGCPCSTRDSDLLLLLLPMSCPLSSDSASCSRGSRSGASYARGTKCSSWRSWASCWQADGARCWLPLSHSRREVVPWKSARSEEGLWSCYLEVDTARCLASNPAATHQNLLDERSRHDSSYLISGY
jgi:hypothetical protein